VSFTVSNGGDGTSGALSVAVGGTDPSQFVVTSDGCSQSTLASQQTCVVAVTFEPSTGTTGAQQATLTVSATPGGSPSAALDGTAAMPAKIAWTAPSGFSGFGTVVPPDTSAATFTLMNSGGVACGVVTVSIAGNASAEFTTSQDGCSGHKIGAGQSCTVDVTFAPSASASGTQQATLNATASPGGTPSYSLSGTVGEPPDAGTDG
jgi:hypothetical protein